MPRVDEQLLAHAKHLRRDMTPAEARLWYNLRAKRFERAKFVRQSVRRPYIADFIARSRKIIIEVDGDTHGTTQEYDARRSANLGAQGYRVLRFTNADVMGTVEGVLLTIRETPATAPLPIAACGGSLPLPGGEREKL